MTCGVTTGMSAIVSELTHRAITTWHPEPVQRLLRKRAQGWEG